MVNAVRASGRTTPKIARKKLFFSTKIFVKKSIISFIKNVKKIDIDLGAKTDIFDLFLGQILQYIFWTVH